jgi:ADP-dependent NAD(P)H-hydrate dehydratase / NAD(P)H-hydrate epimerase
VQPILTPSEAATLDGAAEARGISTSSLMERAGWAVAVAAARVAGGRSGHRVVVVMGPGNNGGDGAVAARVLDGWGMRVSAISLGEGGLREGPAAEQLRRLVAETRVTLFEYAEAPLARELDRADVVVDAIFGTGFHGEPKDRFADAIGQLSTSSVPIVAVDTPSGVDGATGEVAGSAVRATRTVCLGALKPGVVLPPGSFAAGEVEVADIGFPPDLIGSNLCLVEASDVAAGLPHRAPDTHKRATGVALIVGGSRAMTGAVSLMAEAAAAVGAGLVVVATPQSAMPVVQANVTEAVFLPLPETKEGTAAEDALGALMDKAAEVDAVAVGPGMTTEAETQALVRSFAGNLPKPFVLDADGLNAFAGRSAALAERKAAAVLTPHAGEFARLSGHDANEIARNRVAAVRGLARETNAAVLLKGSRTVIASAEGSARVNPTGTSFLATAGSGDVLTGMTAGLIARGVDPFDAATTAAYLHGVAGSIAGASTGEGTTAGDVVAAVPSAVRRVSRGDRA